MIVYHALENFEINILKKIIELLSSTKTGTVVVNITSKRMAQKKLLKHLVI